MRTLDALVANGAMYAFAMTPEQKAALGLPTTWGEYDTDAEMIAQVLRERFVNVHVKVLPYSELEGRFGGGYPWFFRFCFTVLGKEIFQDIGFEEWYETKDKLRIIYMVEKVLMNSLLNYIVGKGLRNTK